MSLSRVEQFNGLHGDGIGSDTLDTVYLIGIVVDSGLASGGPGHSTIVEIEGRILRHVTGGGTESHVIGRSYSQQVASCWEVKILVKGIAVGEVVLHRGSNAVVGAGV